MTLRRGESGGASGHGQVASHSFSPCLCIWAVAIRSQRTLSLALKSRSTKSVVSSWLVALDVFQSESSDDMVRGAHDWQDGGVVGVAALGYVFFEDVYITDCACTVDEDFEATFNVDGCPRRELVEVQGSRGRQGRQPRFAMRFGT